MVTKLDGVVIANDVDKKRCYMLAHHLLKLNSPCFLVANSPAQGFPVIKLAQQQAETPVLNEGRKEKRNEMKRKEKNRIEWNRIE